MIMKTHREYVAKLSLEEAREALRFEAQKYRHAEQDAKAHGRKVHSATARNWRSLSTALRAHIAKLEAPAPAEAPAPVQVIQPDTAAPPITTQSAALSTAQKAALLWLNSQPPARQDERGRPVWEYDVHHADDSRENRTLCARLERLDGISAKTGVFRRRTGSPTRIQGGYRYVFVAERAFAAYLAYPDKKEIKAQQEARLVARHEGETEEERALHRARDRNALTDFTIRTCGYCFRDIKATGPAETIVDHGYTIRHGFRSGRCGGVGQRPYEEEPTATRLALQGLLDARRRAVAARAHLDTKPPLQVEERYAAGPSRPLRSTVAVRVTIGPDDPRYRRVHAREVASADRAIRIADATGFPGWKWYAVALKHWSPGRADAPAVGAPRLDHAEVQAMTVEAATRLAAG